MAGARNFEYDVFISYSSRNYRKVLSLAEGLRNRGLKVWFDRWILDPGADIPMGVNEGLERARRVIVCLSPEYLEADWTLQELSIVLTQDPANKSRCLIPLLIKRVTLPANLNRLVYADGRRLDEALISKLADQCRPPGKSSEAVQPGARIDTYGNIVAARAEHVRKVLQHLRTSKPGVAILEPFGFGADQTVDQIVDVLRDQHDVLVAVRLVPERQTTKATQLYEALERDVLKGLEARYDGALKGDLLKAWRSSDAEQDPASRFESRIDDLLDYFGRLKPKRQLLLLIAGLANVDDELLLRLGSLLHRNCNHGLRLLVWGRRELHELMTRPPGDGASSAFHRLAREELLPLARSEIDELLKRRGNDAGGAGDTVAQLSGGHPALVRELLGPDAPADLLNGAFQEIEDWLLHWDHMAILARSLSGSPTVAAFLRKHSRNRIDAWAREYVPEEEALYWLGIMARDGAVKLRFTTPLMRRLPELLT